MIEKVNKFPLEKLYFLESEQFLDKVDKVFLKNNDTFKLNSYCLGISKQKYNNDNFLYLFNGLRGYYDVKTRFLKKPAVMQVKPPLSKKVFFNDFLIKKYRYSDLLIFSLNDFNRPTVTLFSDTAGNLYYDFPYRLVDYLNKQRHNKVLQNSYENWRKNYCYDLRHVSLFFKKKYKARKKSGFFGAKMLPAFVLGRFDELVTSYFKFQQLKLHRYRKLVKVVFSRKKLKNKGRNKRRRRRRFFGKSSFKLKKFYKTPRLIKRFFLLKKRAKFFNKIKKGFVFKRLFLKIFKNRLFFFSDLHKRKHLKKSKGFFIKSYKKLFFKRKLLKTKFKRLFLKVCAGKVVTKSTIFKLISKSILKSRKFVKNKRRFNNKKSFRKYMLGRGVKNLKFVRKNEIFKKKFRRII